MASQYYIGGVRFYRRSIIKLSGDEKAQIAIQDSGVLRRPVQWPLADRIPDFSRAYIDLGGTAIWGAGPYLKVPNTSEDVDSEVVNRVFCPYGYPPNRLRIARSNAYIDITAVALEKLDDADWYWMLSVKTGKMLSTPDAE